MGRRVSSRIVRRTRPILSRCQSERTFFLLLCRSETSSNLMDVPWPSDQSRVTRTGQRDWVTNGLRSKRTQPHTRKSVVLERRVGKPEARMASWTAAGQGEQLFPTQMSACRRIFSLSKHFRTEMQNSGLETPMLKNL